MAREANGPTITHVVKREADGVAFIAANVARGSTIHADEASHWDKLAAYFPIKRINHQEAYSKDGACTNAAEAFFSRMRRAEMAWRETAAVNQMAVNTRWQRLL